MDNIPPDRGCGSVASIISPLLRHLAEHIDQLLHPSRGEVTGWENLINKGLRIRIKLIRVGLRDLPEALPLRVALGIIPGFLKHGLSDMVC
jgi:hypothetical protein